MGTRNTKTLRRLGVLAVGVLLLSGCSSSAGSGTATGTAVTSADATSTSTASATANRAAPQPSGPAGTSGSSATDPDTQPSSLEVDTTTGTVRGVEVGATRQFLGIRYALPPVGERRWTLPEPAADTDAVLDASKPGSPCPQGGDPALGVGSTDEDCLFVNVTTPARASDQPRPVMVWWHGGGFTSGAGAQYDAQRLADQGDVVVVTANYRLGMFGYLGLPALAGSGNFGFADQLLALRWANDNAAAFGGNPDNVTVFGESAGGISVCAALTSPAAAGLVDRAIASSGSCRLAWPTGTLFPGIPAVQPIIPLTDSEALGATAAAAVGCHGPDIIGCLRSVPVDQIVAQATTFGNPLAYGTELLPQEPAAAVTAGKVLTVPVISGGNLDEHRSFIGGLMLTNPTAVTDATYPTLIQASFGDQAAAVEAHYPRSGFDSAPLAWATLVTDVAWACTTTHGARDLAAAGAQVWSYEFADRTAPDVSKVASSGLPQGAAHATDLPYLFDLGGQNLLTGPGQPELADTMIALWSSFAHTGTPTADGVDWPGTTGTDAPVLQLGNPSVAVVDHRAEHQCGFWESIGLG